MLVPNNTHYHLPTSKLYHEVESPDSWQSESGKRNAYYQRLYFEYEYTKSVNGLAFFYTLTYNNKSIPVWNDGLKDYYVFNYDDIRYVTNGRLSKVLLREYGARLKYICTCETGEDKGQRGLGNNPHYHFIFFVSPCLKDDGTPDYEHYTKISPFRFRGLLREIWQGSTKYIPFQDAKFGICKEGDHLGVVDSPEGMKYVIKYVLKSDVEKATLAAVRRYYELQCDCTGYDLKFLYAWYKYNKYFNPFITKQHFYDTYKLSSFHRWYKVHRECNMSLWLKKCEPYGHKDFRNLQLLKKLDEFYVEWFYPNYVDFHVRQWKNKYSGKVRISKSVGEYGLNFVENPDDDPKFKLYESKAIRIQTPCLYYYRKLYYNTKVCPYTGNTLYYLNERGVSLHCKMLPVRVKKLSSDVFDSFSYATMNKLDIDMSDSPFQRVLDDVKLPFDDSFLMRFCRDFYSRDYEDIIRRYSIYKLVYEHRHYDSFDSLIDDSLSINAVIQDYRYFIQQSCYNLDYDSDTLSELFLNYDTWYSRCKGLKSFSDLPYFLPYLDFFKYIDYVRSVVHSVKGDIQRDKWRSQSEHQRRLNSFKYNGYELLHACNLW